MPATWPAGKTLDLGGGSIEGAPKNGFGATPFFPVRLPISRREMSKSRLQRMTPEDDVPGGINCVRIANKGSSGWVLRLRITLENNRYADMH